MSDPIRIHPHNPKLFEYQGRPLVLLTATEHYGAVMNRPFRFEPYLADAGMRKQTLTRLFVLFRELQTPVNPYSTCKPESPDYIAPFERTGPGRALDGELQFDLDRWNPEFFERLHRFVGMAGDYGIIVEVVLFSNTYGADVWALNPLNSRNNVNGLPEIQSGEYITQRCPALWERQAQHARKIVVELNSYDNVFYEICNEPGAHPEDNVAPTSLDEVNAWQTAVAEVIRETERGLPKKHLIAASPCWQWTPFEQACDAGFDRLPVDIVNIHPLPDTVHRGKRYDMGAFMSKQLRLRGLRDFSLATYGESRPVNQDEDNAASQYKDFDGWTIHRKRAWTTLLGGSHYDYIDFSIINYCETGTEESRRCVRSWFGHLSEYVHGIDLINARPMEDWLKAWPENTCPSVFGVPGKDYTIYLPDARELDETGAGTCIRGHVGFELEKGAHRYALYSPVSGMYSPWLPLAGGDADIALPSFRHDLTVRIVREDG